MPTKNNEELEAQGATAETGQEEAAENNVAENEAGSDEKPKRTKKAKSDDANSETTEDSSLIGSVLDTVTSAVSGVANVIADGVSAVVEAVTPDSTTETNKSHQHKRAEKIGIVQSDKMTNTVTVRVDRVVKHPVYRKYIKRRKKFMAHDEKGAAIGDKVRIVETRPLSAKKRWRVVEIIQKAER